MFINLPLRHAIADATLVERFLRESIHPEIGLDSHSLDRLPEQWHHDLADRLSKAGIPCSVHLPRFWTCIRHPKTPSSVRPAMDRLSKAVRIAKIYGPAHMVGHPCLHEAFFEGSVERQRANSCATWGAVLDQWPGHPPLFLENTHDSDPGVASWPCSRSWMPRKSASASMSAIGTGFALGHVRHDLERWVASLRSFQNAPSSARQRRRGSDQHLGMGQGSIPWDEFARLLAEYNLRLTATAEPHTPEAFEQTMAFLRSHEMGQRVL